jgi:hypothetical protein
MSGGKPRCQARDHRHRGRDHTEPQQSRETAAQTREIDPQTVILAESLLGPGEHPVTLGGKAQETVAANDKPDFEIVLQLTDSGRKRGLGNMARLRRP